MWPHEHWADQLVLLTPWLILANTAQYYSNLLLQGYTADSYLISALQGLSCPFLQDCTKSQSRFQDFALGFVELHAFDSCYFHSSRPSERSPCSPAYPPLPWVWYHVQTCWESPAPLSGALKMLNSVGQMLFSNLLLKKKKREWWNHISYGGLAHMKTSMFMCQCCLLGISKIILKTMLLHGWCLCPFFSYEEAVWWYC